MVNGNRREEYVKWVFKLLELDGKELGEKVNGERKCDVNMLGAIPNYNIKRESNKEEAKYRSSEGNKDNNIKDEIVLDINDEEEIYSTEEEEDEEESPAREVKITKAKARSRSKRKNTNSSVARSAERTRGSMSRTKSKEVIRFLKEDHSVTGPKCYPGLTAFEYITNEKNRRGWFDLARADSMVNFTKAGLKLLFKEKTREETIKEDLEANILMDVNPSELRRDIHH